MRIQALLGLLSTLSLVGLVSTACGGGDEAAVSRQELIAAFREAAAAVATAEAAPVAPSPAHSGLSPVEIISLVQQTMDAVPSAEEVILLVQEEVAARRSVEEVRSLVQEAVAEEVKTLVQEAVAAAVPASPRINVFSPTTDSYDSNAGVFTKDYGGLVAENHNALTIWQRERPDLIGTNNPGGCIGFGGAVDTRAPNAKDTGAAICYWIDGEDSGAAGRLMLLNKTSGATLNPTSPLTSLSVAAGRIEVMGVLDTNTRVITVGGNAPATGTAGIILPDGEAFSGLVANQAGLYADDVGGTVEVFAIDEAGNTTQLSSHPATLLDQLPAKDCEYPWAFHSANEYLGKEVYVDWCGAIKALEQVTGQRFVFFSDIPKRDWYSSQLAACDSAFESLTASEQTDFTCEIEDPPLWLRERGVEAKPNIAWNQP